jgi:DNA modification methylase
MQEEQSAFIKNNLNKIICGDALASLKRFPSESIDCLVTSPPYFSLRDYGVKEQIGLETNFNEYLEKLLTIFNEVKRALKPMGTCWIVMGDTYGRSSSASGGGKLFRGNKETSSLAKKSPKFFRNKNNTKNHLCKFPPVFRLQ